MSKPRSFTSAEGKSQATAFTSIAVISSVAKSLGTNENKSLWRASGILLAIGAHPLDNHTEA